MERILRMSLALFPLLAILPTNTSQEASTSDFATSSKYQIECNMCAACDNPCGQVPSPPPPPPPSSPPLPAATSSCLPPPSPAPSQPNYTYSSLRHCPTKGGSGLSYPPTPPDGHHLPEWKDLQTMSAAAAPSKTSDLKTYNVHPTPPNGHHLPELKHLETMSAAAAAVAPP